MTLEDPKLWKILPGGVPYVYRAEKRQDMTDKITTVGKVIENQIKKKKKKNPSGGFSFYLFKL